MELVGIETWNFRNLEDRVVEIDPGLNVVFGANGQGKTNFLEAIAVVGNVRSFRRTSPRKIVRHGQPAFRVEARVRNRYGEVHLKQIVEISTSVSRRLEVDGVSVSLTEYLAEFPVFSLSSADIELVVGSPENRRSFIDRLVFFDEPKHLDDLRDYRRRLRQRNAALSSGRELGELEIWEEGLARAAAVIVTRRDQGIRRWRERFSLMYEDLRGSGFPDLCVEYRGEISLPTEGEEEVAEFYRRRYDKSRVRDVQAGFTHEGPHRHDLVLKAGGRSVRDVLSAGQVRTVAAALWIASLTQVEERKGELLPVLVDDADAELDDHVFRRMVDSLGRSRQVVMTSAHKRGLAGIVPDAAWWLMNAGELRRHEGLEGF